MNLRANAWKGSLHQHHQIIKSESDPTAQPAHLPISELGAKFHRSAKAKEFRFHLHVCVSTISCREHTKRRLFAPPEIRAWGVIHAERASEIPTNPHSRTIVRTPANNALFSRRLPVRIIRIFTRVL